MEKIEKYQQSFTQPEVDILSTVTLQKFKKSMHFKN